MSVETSDDFKVLPGFRPVYMAKDRPIG